MGERYVVKATAFDSATRGKGRTYDYWEEFPSWYLEGEHHGAGRPCSETV